MKLDKTDKQIVNILQSSGRESASNIAEKLNVSVPTVTERIKKLQDSKIITGFQAILSPAALGLDISAIITVISGSSKNYKEITSEAEDTPEVVQTIPGWIHNIKNIGNDDLIVLLWANEIFDNNNPDTFFAEV